MEILIITLVSLHFASVLVIVLDWLRCAKFPYIVDGVIFTLTVIQFVVVSQVCAWFVGFNGVERALFGVAVYLVARLAIPKIKNNGGNNANS